MIQQTFIAEKDGKAQMLLNELAVSRCKFNIPLAKFFLDNIILYAYFVKRFY